MTHHHPTRPLTIGGRGSPLSVAQLVHMQARLAETFGVADKDAAFPISTFTTTGDRITDRKLIEAGGKGLFTKELDEALLDGRIDLAVHCLKDMPTKLPDGIMLVAIPEREDPRDVLLTLDGRTLDELPEGTVLGTASLRRQSQLLHHRPDLQIVTLRGNVATRLGRLASGDVAATCLARAGLSRLGMLGEKHAVLDPVLMPPAAGQGALAIVVRADDAETQAVIAQLDDADARLTVAAERSFLEALDGSCRTAIGAWARVEGDTFHFSGEALTGDGTQVWRRDVAVPLAGLDEAGSQALGLAAGREIRAEAGDALFADV